MTVHVLRSKCNIFDANESVQSKTPIQLTAEVLSFMQIYVKVTKIKTAKNPIPQCEHIPRTVSAPDSVSIRSTVNTPAPMPLPPVPSHTLKSILGGWGK
jgi:hypothetical protein